LGGAVEGRGLELVRKAWEFKFEIEIEIEFEFSCCLRLPKTLETRIGEEEEAV
jgi:hypothetical protein